MYYKNFETREDFIEYILVKYIYSLKRNQKLKRNIKKIEGELCQFEGCKNLRYYRNPYCNSHENQLRRGKELTPILAKKEMKSNRRLSDNDVREIRKLHAEKKYKIKEIAEMYSTVPSNIGQIVNYRSFKDIE